MAFEADLLRDVTALAHDDFLGREAGTVDELRAAAWVAERAREAGLRRVHQIGVAPVLWLGAASLPDVSGGQRIRATLTSESFVYPSANIVAMVPGTDLALANAYVLFSAHHDHLGVVAPVDGDSIINGADDSAAACAALLAIGRAFVERPGRRPTLFVWHGTEEKGLGGSVWYSQNPTVPDGSIVAVLNADMIARNDPDSAALLGMVPPHRNSLDLVEMALAANNAVAGFALDTLWDRPDHRDGFYFRSDHRPYAQIGVPRDGMERVAG